MNTKILKTLLGVVGIMAFAITVSAASIRENGWGTDTWGGNEPQTTETVTDRQTNESLQTSEDQGTVDNRTVVVVVNVISEEPLDPVSAVSISGLTGLAGKVPEVQQIRPTLTTALGWTVTVFDIDGTIVAVGISPSRDTSAPPSDREIGEIREVAPPPSPPPPTPSPTPVPTPTFSPPPSPTLSLTANPSSIVRGETSRLSWSSNADSCIADCISGDCVEWDANPAIGLGTYTPTSGSQAVSPDVTATYRLSCFTSAGGFAQAEQTISVGQIKWREIIPRLPGLFLFDQFFARR